MTVQKPWEIDLTVYTDETALLDGLRRGDRLACTCLMKRFAPRLYRLALQLTASPDDAEDVLQEGFAQACRQIDQYAARGGLGGWLRTIVVNTALMRLRRRTLPTVAIERPFTRRDALAAEALELPDDAATPEQQTMDRELRRQIEEALQKLPETLRIALVLRDLEGLSTTEAAASLGIREAALKVRLHRARLALRAALSPYVHDQPAETEDEL